MDNAKILVDPAQIEMNGTKALDCLQQLRCGIGKITMQQFRDALKRSINANKDYADKCWDMFQKTPMYYICARHPLTEGIELVELLLRLGGSK
jgi:hypothetical protein